METSVVQAVRARGTEARTHIIAYVHSRGSSHRTTLFSVVLLCCPR